MLTKYYIIAIIILTVALGGLTKVYLLKTEELAVTKVELTQKTKAFDDYIAKIAELSLRNTKLEEENGKIANKEREAVRELENLRNREQVVLAKTGLVALKINKAFQARQEALACLTGDFSLCSKD